VRDSYVINTESMEFRTSHLCCVECMFICFAFSVASCELPKVMRQK